MSVLDDNVFMIHFDPDSIQEHYSGLDEDDDPTVGMSNEDLQRAGVLAKDWFQSEDAVWQAFGECLGAAIRKIKEEEA